MCGKVKRFLAVNTKRCWEIGKHFLAQEVTNRDGEGNTQRVCYPHFRRPCCFIMMTYKCMEKAKREEEIADMKGKSVERKEKAKLTRHFSGFLQQPLKHHHLVSCRKSFNNTCTKELVRRVIWSNNTALLIVWGLPSHTLLHLFFSKVIMLHCIYMKKVHLCMHYTLCLYSKVNTSK